MSAGHRFVGLTGKAYPSSVYVETYTWECSCGRSGKINDSPRFPATRRRARAAHAAHAARARETAP